MLKDQILGDIKSAMKSKDKERLGTLRLISAGIKQFEVDNRVDIKEEDVLAILNKMVKQRRESITQFEKANRNDLIDIEQKELVLIQTYLPEPLDEKALTKLIQKAISDTNAQSIKDMGKVMANLKSAVEGRADMSALSQSVKTQLSTLG